MKTILIVEDSQSERELIAGLLQLAGHSTAIVSSAELAWEWLKNHTSPDLILLDIMLPNETGLEFCRKIRASSQWESIPIVFCTAKCENSDKFWALRQGGNELIGKPFSPDQLINTLSRYLE